MFGNNLFYDRKGKVYTWSRTFYLLIKSGIRPTSKFWKGEKKNLVILELGDEKNVRTKT